MCLGDSSEQNRGRPSTPLGPYTVLGEIDNQQCMNRFKSYVKKYMLRGRKKIEGTVDLEY